MKEKKVLVICYTFPPMSGIGGRRWAKFAKYLAKEGYTVHIAAAENLRPEVSVWNSDIAENPKIIPKYYLFSHQRTLSRPLSIIEKISRKILISYLKFTKYSPDFITSLPNSAFWKEIKNTILRESIKCVIVSGDPFLFYQASQLKKELSFKLILDYRDLWSDHSFYKKYVPFTKKQTKFFHFAENEAINNCDKIITVDEHLKEVLSKRLRSPKKELFEVIHNGFDIEDFKDISDKKTTSNEKIKLYFSGNIASDKNDSLLHFIDSFYKLSLKDKKLYDNFDIRFYGTMDFSLIQKIKDYNLSNLDVVNKTFPLADYTNQLIESDIGILLVSSDYPHSFYTKFTDYLYLNKFMLAIGYEGELSKFLESNKLGCIFTLEDDYTFFYGLLEKIKYYTPASNAIKNNFDISSLVKKYIKIIES